MYNKLLPQTSSFNVLTNDFSFNQKMRLLEKLLNGSAHNVILFHNIVEATARFIASIVNIEYML